MNEALWSDERIDRRCEEAFDDVGDGFAYRLMREMRDEYEADRREIIVKFLKRARERAEELERTEGLVIGGRFIAMQEVLREMGIEVEI